VTLLVCYEPERPGAAWQPFTGVRPIAELTAGAWRIRDRWAGVLGVESAVVMGSHMAGFADAGSAPVREPGPVQGPAVVARSDFAPAGTPVALAAGVTRLTCEEQTVAWIVREGSTWNGPVDTGPAMNIDGMLLRGAWDLVTALERLLHTDCAGALADGADPVPAGSLVLGNPAEVGCFGAAVEPGVVFDVRHGAVVLEEGVQVRSGTRLEGPLYVGASSLLLGGAVRHSAIGPRCRVHGEMSTSVMLGYSNKSHDGFVGHSVIGQWVNLGAGTITSNLKNTYGEVRLELAGARVPTGRTNLGTLLGDHAKTAIGTLLSTGTVVGAGANVVGAPVPRWVPPFAWGTEGAELLDAEGFIRIAKRILPRREVAVDAALEASLRAIYGRLAR
jgi:UDP-N-acetylglucosamine diphosphorylase / glucose-1-phosphate thymidylyltransferase / UDP-N-acetylgalactosamine diphosphorylase / glucosamine-1-phosphate N-acetyltransferase / galactosamine-1-phosphate N-acetyltransferase